MPWESKGMPNESIKPTATSGNSPDSSLKYVSFRTRVKFNDQCLKQDKVTFTHKKVVNIYIAF